MISTPVQQHSMPLVFSVKFLRTSAANCERALSVSKNALQKTRDVRFEGRETECAERHRDTCDETKTRSRRARRGERGGWCQISKVVLERRET
jgi:hypothetical protein